MIVQLFTTLGCHLCEQAHEQLLSLTDGGMDLSIELVEIADSEDLMDRYGITIPVIRTDDREILWPFSVGALRAFLENDI
ncbi:MAG: glutaredoxin family protein [Pseudomonadales bacterium]|nr:glutaredoxin family protein [Pseudomonadales bacterium]